MLDRDSLSPWLEGGHYCGSRDMALPLLGLKVRLTGRAAEAFDCPYFAAFIDGSVAGPILAGEPCQACSLAALEAFQMVIVARAAKAAGLKPLLLKKPAAPNIKVTKVETSRWKRSSNDLRTNVHYRPGFTPQSVWLHYLSGHCRAADKWAVVTVSSLRLRAVTASMKRGSFKTASTCMSGTDHR